MPFFKVIVEQTVHVPVSVEADTVEHAEERAIELAKDAPGREIVHHDIYTLVETVAL